MNIENEIHINQYTYKTINNMLIVLQNSICKPKKITFSAIKIIIFGGSHKDYIIFQQDE